MNVGGRNDKVGDSIYCFADRGIVCDVVFARGRCTRWCGAARLIAGECSWDLDWRQGEEGWQGECHRWMLAIEFGHSGVLGLSFGVHSSSCAVACSVLGAEGVVL